MSALPSIDVESYVVTCGACARFFDATAALWCRCVTKDVAVACPYCGHCVCKQGRIAARDFWFRAPQSLVARRAEEKARRKNAHAIRAVKPTRVLIVDDDEEIRLITEYALRELGYDTVTASGPAEAIEEIANGHPDVVLTDALMPGGDGRELCRSIKNAFPEMKVIVMTSLYTSHRYASEAHRRFHADDYLAKPIDFDRLRIALLRVVASR